MPTTVNGRGLRSAQWRVLNALNRSQIASNHRASELLNAQDATNDDMLDLHLAGLIGASFFGTTARLDLREHLAHHGSTFVIRLDLTGRGASLVRSDVRNRVLMYLGGVNGRRVSLARVMAHARTTDARELQGMYRSGQIAIAHNSDGTPIQDDLDTLLRHIPAATLTARLTNKGRQYLPL